MDLQWPKQKCVCGFDLREQTPKATEKGIGEDGKPIWTDFCRQCGHGYPVGTREVKEPKPEEPKPAEETKEEAVEPTETKLETASSPEDELPLASTTTGTSTGEEVPEGFYYCSKCKVNHRETSKIGNRHKKYKQEEGVATPPAEEVKDAASGGEPD